MYFLCTLSSANKLVSAVSGRCNDEEWEKSTNSVGPQKEISALKKGPSISHVRVESLLTSLSTTHERAILLVTTEVDRAIEFWNSIIRATYCARRWRCLVHGTGELVWRYLSASTTLFSCSHVHVRPVAIRSRLHLQPQFYEQWPNVVAVVSRAPVILFENHRSVFHSTVFHVSTRWLTLQSAWHDSMWQCQLMFDSALHVILYRTASPFKLDRFNYPI